MAKKKSKKKSGGGGSGQPIWLYIVILSVLIVGAVVLLLVRPSSRASLALVSLISGIPVGFTSNPVLLRIGEDVIRFAQHTGAGSRLPVWDGNLAAVLSPSGAQAGGVLVLLVVMFIATALAHGMKGKPDWRIVLLMAGGGAAGSYFAHRALNSGELAKAVFSYYFNDPFYIKVAIGLLALFTLAHYVVNRSSAQRHWLVCAPLGPIVGFWSFYVTRAPVHVMFFLTAFSLIVAANMGARRTLIMLPPIMGTIWLSRLIFMYGSGTIGIMRLNGGGAKAIDVIIASLCAGAAIFLCQRIAFRLKDRAFEVVFACGLAVFLVMFFAGR